MTNVSHAARPYMSGLAGHSLGGQLGRFARATGALVAELRDVYAVERNAQKLAQATRHLDRRLLRDIGLDHGAS